MFYTLPVTKKGTITVPKQARIDLGATSKILLVKTKQGYQLKPVSCMAKLGGSLKPKQKYTDEQIQASLAGGFLQNKD